MNWTEVSVVTDGEAAEAVAELLRPYAHDESVVLEQLGDLAAEDENALEPRVTVKIYLTEVNDTPRLRRRIEESLYHMGRLYPIAAPTFLILEEKDWANAWREHYAPFRVGQRIWIQPSWEPRAETEGSDIVITLDPGMAFGTGLHPTTQMCLRAVEELTKNGDRVLDVGTGSGILSIAALKLGASRVLAVDTDEIAVEAALENARRNNVEQALQVQVGSLDSVEQTGWDLILVNILAPVIIELLERADLLRFAAIGGHLVLSGIIDSQLEGVVTAVQKRGGVVDAAWEVRDWRTLIISAPHDSTHANARTAEF